MPRISTTFGFFSSDVAYTVGALGRGLTCLGVSLAMTGPAHAQAETSAASAQDVPPPPVPPPVDAEGEPARPQAKVEKAPATGASIEGDDESSSASGLRLHTMVGLAKAVAGYQRSEFGFGGFALADVEWGPARTWGIQAEVGFVGLGGSKRVPPEGLAELGAAAGGHVGVGLRVRPFAAMKRGDGDLYPAGPWISAVAGASYTGGSLAPLVDAFVGYDFSISETFSWGPTAGYMLVIQTKEEPRDDSAHLVLLGLHGCFDLNRPAVRLQDRDHDGILDQSDACPDEPEDRDGFEDDDGCPELDNDEDQIPDAEDHCPIDPEDRDDFEDADGCPDPDNDKDDVLDPDDQCQNEPEDKDGFRDDDGCPDGDNDLDGIPDLKDLCPNEPETRNGVSDNDGCPDEESVRVVGDKIELDQKIHFWTNSDRIRPMSYPVLEKLADFLVKHPEYVHISVEGHADARGEEDFNLRLSKERALSILEFLAERGVARERLASEGYGSSRPLVEGATEHAWFMNRRVEFVVTRNREVVVDPKTGAPVSGVAPATEPPPASDDVEVPDSDEGAP